MGDINPVTATIGLHASSHFNAGSDPLSVLQLGGYGGSSTNFLREDGTWALPASGAVAHKDTHKSGGSDAFVKADILIAQTRYVEIKADPASDTGAFWLESGTKNLKYWDNIGTPVKQTVELLSNKGVASGYCDLDGAVLVPVSRLPAATTSVSGVVELATDGESGANVVVQGNDARMSNARTPTAHTHVKANITDFAHTHLKADITDFTHVHVKADITDFAHTHVKANITDFAHTHVKVDITDFAHTHVKADIPSATMYEDEDNNLGDHYLDIGDIAAPANPSAGIRRIFLDTSTGKLSVRSSAGATISLEEGGAGGGEANTSSNVGTGEGTLAKAKVGVDLPFKSLKQGTNITITNNTDDVTISASGGGGGEANTSSNAGTGLGWAKTKVGVDLPFKSVTATSTKIALANNTNDIGIDVTEANLTHDNIGGTLGTAKGGTGQTTVLAAFNALSPLTTLGDILYNNGTDDVRLAGNITGTRKFLRQLGTGAVSAAPAWDTLVSGDLPSHTHVKADITDFTHTHVKADITDFAHAATHKSGGSDPIKLDELAATTDVTTLNASNTAHGLLLKLANDTTKYLRSDGTWNVPPDLNTDTKVIVKEGGTQVGSAARALNFAIAGNFDITEDIANDEFDIDIADNAITDSLIAAHTTTKITTTNKALLNSAIVYNDQANSFGDFAQTFKDNQLKINNPADTFAITIIAPAIVAARNFTLPLLGANDIAVAEAFTQPITNKTINASSNTINDTSIATGDILKSNGTKFVRMQRGTALQVLRTNSGATDLEFASLNSENAGTATGTGNASTTVFNIAHSLGSTPYMAFVVVSSVLGSTINFSYTYDATNIVVTFASAPAAGTITFQWSAVL